jgi:hypothetical protein
MSEATAEAAVELTENAARRIAEILRSELAGTFLRIGVVARRRIDQDVTRFSRHS